MDREIPKTGESHVATLQGTNISPQKWHFEDDFPFPKVGYVNPLEGIFLFGFFRLPGGPAVPRLYVTQSQRRTKREGGKNPGGELSPSGFKVDPLLVRNELITPISRIINPSYIICFWPFMIRLILLHV